MACLSTFDVGGCGCGPDCGDCCVDCAPCKIPKADLTLAYVNAISGNGSLTLRWDGSAWSSGCVLGGTGLRFDLACVGGQITFTVTYYLSGANCSGSSQTCRYPTPGVGGTFTLASYTCDPFSLHFTCSGAGCAVVNASGYTDFTITGPSNSPYGFPVCCQTFAVTGCNDLALPGATVSVYDSEGGSLLASEVTPASGLVNLWWSGSCDIWVEVTYPDGPGGPRFAAYGQSLSLTKGFTSDVALSPTADYHCIPCCAVPVYKTYYLTNAITGTRAVTWISGAQWGACYDEPIPSVNCDDGSPTTGAPVTYAVGFLDNCKTVFEVTAPRCAFTGVSGTASGELGSSFDCAHSHGFGACAGSASTTTNCVPPFNVSGTVSGTTCTTFLGAGSTLAGSE